MSVLTRANFPPGMFAEQQVNNFTRRDLTIDFTVRNLLENPSSQVSLQHQQQRGTLYCEWRVKVSMQLRARTENWIALSDPSCK